MATFLIVETSDNTTLVFDATEGHGINLTDPNVIVAEDHEEALAMWRESQGLTGTSYPNDAPGLPIPHYHCIASMAGYLPDYNEVYDTREDAREDAAWYVEAYDDMNASSDEYPEYYDIDARDPDYIVVGRGGPDSYAMPIIVEVVECLDHTCTRETD